MDFYNFEDGLDFLGCGGGLGVARGCDLTYFEFQGEAEMTSPSPKSPFTTEAPPPTGGGTAPPPTQAKAKLEMAKPKPAKNKKGSSEFEEGRAVALVRGDKLFDREKAEEAVASLLVRVLQGMSIDSACSAIGITTLDYHFMLREFPDFRHRLQQAIIDNALRMESRAPELIDRAQHAQLGRHAQIAKITLEMILKNSAIARKVASEMEGEMGKESPRLVAEGMTSKDAPVYDAREDREYRNARK